MHVRHKGNLDVLRILVEEWSIHLHTDTLDGYSAVHIAAEHGGVVLCSVVIG